MNGLKTSVKYFPTSLTAILGADLHCSLACEMYSLWYDAFPNLLRDLEIVCVWHSLTKDGPVVISRWLIFVPLILWIPWAGHIVRYQRRLFVPEMMEKLERSERSVSTDE